jgi:hypothetical protein
MVFLSGSVPRLWALRFRRLFTPRPRRRCRLMPVMDVPLKGANEHPARAKDGDRSRIIGNGRVGDDAHGHGVRVIDRPRRGRRVVVGLLRSVLRLHDLGAGIRARRGRNSRNRQCNHNQFLSHDLYPSDCFRIEPVTRRKVAKQSRSCFNSKSDHKATENNNILFSDLRGLRVLRGEIRGRNSRQSVSADSGRDSLNSSRLDGVCVV